MIHDVDVIVQVPTRTVGMRRNEEVWLFIIRGVVGV